MYKFICAICQYYQKQYLDQYTKTNELLIRGMCKCVRKRERERREGESDGLVIAGSGTRLSILCLSHISSLEPDIT